MVAHIAKYAATVAKVPANRAANNQVIQRWIELASLKIPFVTPLFQCALVPFETRVGGGALASGLNTMVTRCQHIDCPIDTGKSKSSGGHSTSIFSRNDYYFGCLITTLITTFEISILWGFLFVLSGEVFPFYFLFFLVKCFLFCFFGGVSLLFLLLVPSYVSYCVASYQTCDSDIPPTHNHAYTLARNTVVDVFFRIFNYPEWNLEFIIPEHQFVCVFLSLLLS